MKLHGPWSSEEIQRFLKETTIPMQIAVNDTNTNPLLISLWFISDGLSLWCATQSSAKILRHMQSHPVCGFQISPETMPYRGVRGQAKVTLSDDDGPRVLETVVDKYIDEQESDFSRWLLARKDTEIAIKLEPLKITSWDYSPRMNKK
jgi:hypothetical protein